MVFSALMDNIHELYVKQLKGRGALVRPKLKYSLKRNLIQLAKSTLYSFVDLKKANDELLQLACRLPYGSTKHCSQLVCSDNGDKEFLPIELFDSYIDMEFEGRMFKAAKGWEKILELNYSNYMQLPPEENRVPHSDHTIFYSKK